MYDYISIDDINENGSYKEWIECLDIDKEFKNFMLKFNIKDVKDGKCESKILKNPEWTFEYVCYILNSPRWEKGEPIMKRDPFVWDNYKTNVLGEL